MKYPIGTKYYEPVYQEAYYILDVGLWILARKGEWINDGKYSLPADYDDWDDWILEIPKEDLFDKLYERLI